MVVATPAEARPLARCSVSPGQPVVLDAGVTLLSGGIGVERAQGAARALLRSGVEALVSWGTAAGLHASVAPGALLLPERVVGFGGMDFVVDRRWHRELADALQGRFAFRPEPLAHAGGVLHGPDDKRALLTRTSAMGADMESAAVAAVAREAGVSFLVVRAVSDGAHDSVPRAISSAIGIDGGLRPGHFLAAWSREPGETRAILGLARGWWAARRTLLGVAEAAGPRLGMD